MLFLVFFDCWYTFFTLNLNFILCLHLYRWFLYIFKQISKFFLIFVFPWWVLLWKSFFVKTVFQIRKFLIRLRTYILWDRLKNLILYSNFHIWFEFKIILYGFNLRTQLIHFFFILGVNFFLMKMNLLLYFLKLIKLFLNFQRLFMCKVFDPVGLIMSKIHLF